LGERAPGISISNRAVMLNAKQTGAGSRERSWNISQRYVLSSKVEDFG